MDLDTAKNMILDLLERDGKATNSKMLRLIGGDRDLLNDVREELILDDLAKDKDGIGLISLGRCEEPVSGEVTTAYEKNIVASDGRTLETGHVFISYGRADGTEFAKRLRIDLADNGYGIWMDETDIKPGGLWEARIEKGINLSKVLLAVITPYSLREESVCRDEIVFAINHGKDIIPLKTRKEPLTSLLLGRRNWIDFSGDYTGAFQRLDEYLRNEIGELSSPVLPTVAGVTPFDFSFEIANYAGHFVGRGWLNDQIGKWIAASDLRTMVIVGEAGIGKSAIAAWISQARTSQVKSIHFCTRRDMRTLDPFGYVAALVAQLATQIPGYHDIVKDLNPEGRRDTASAAFRELVTEPLTEIESQPNTQLFIIDSLDESVLQEGESILDVVVNESATLPDWVRIICTTRPEKQILDRIRHLNSFELKAAGEENLEDVAAYVHQQFERPGLPPHVAKNSEYVIEKVIALANGNFLYAKMAEIALLQDNLPISDLESLKGELSDFYLQIFKQRFGDVDHYRARYAPFLNILVASKGPLSTHLLGMLLDCDEGELRLRLQPLRIYMRRLAGPRGLEVSFHHKSLRDWLLDGKQSGVYRADPLEGHTILARTLGDHWAQDDYALRNLPEHLMEIKDFDRVVDLLTNLKYVEAKIKAGMFYELQRDFHRILQLLPEAKAVDLVKSDLQKRLDRYRDDLISFAQGKTQQLHVVEAIEIRSEEEAEPETGRIEEVPSRFEKTKAFADFIHGEGHALVKFGARAGFLIQHAFNSSDSGPVASLAEEHIAGEKGTPLLLAKREGRPRYNPFPLLARTIEGHSDWVIDINLAFDGTTGVSASYDNTLRVWNIQTGECLRVLLGHGDAINRLSITPDGGTAVSASCDKSLRVWDIESGECLRVIDGHTDDIEDVSLTPDGRLAVSAASDKMVRVWDISSGECLTVLEGHKAEVRGVSISADGRMAVSGSLDRTLRVWDIQSGDCLQVLTGHTRGINGVRITPDGGLAVSAGRDKTLRVWDLRLGECLKVLKGHDKEVEGISLTHDGTMTASSSRDRTVRLWDNRSGTCLRVLKGHTGWVNGVCFSCSGMMVVSAGSDKTIRSWNVATGKDQTALPSHAGNVYDLRLTPDHTLAVSGGRDRTIRLWDLETGKQRDVLHGHTGWVNGIRITPDGTKILSVSNDSTVRIWSIQNGDSPRVLVGHKGWVVRAEITLDGTRAVSASYDGTLRVWDIQSGECINVLHGHEDRINGVVINPGGREAISGSSDGTLRVWDMENGECLKVLSGHKDGISCLNVTPDGSCVVSGSWDKSLRLWDLSRGECVKVMEGHNHGVKDVKITFDGRRCVSFSSYGTTPRLWNLADGESLGSFEGHTERVQNVSITPNSRFLASVGHDSTVRLWDLERGESVAVFSAPGSVYSISPITEDGTFAVGLKSGRVITLGIENLG